MNAYLEPISLDERKKGPSGQEAKTTIDYRNEVIDELEDVAVPIQRGQGVACEVEVLIKS